MEAPPAAPVLPVKTTARERILARMRDPPSQRQAAPAGETLERLLAPAVPAVRESERESGATAASASVAAGSTGTAPPGGHQTPSPQSVPPSLSELDPSDPVGRVPGPGDSWVYSRFEVSSIGAHWGDPNPRSQWTL
eukprot:5070673-Alexandrium_andersonii.AAC.1